MLHESNYFFNIFNVFHIHLDALINKYLLLRTVPKFIHYILGKVIHHLCSISVLTVPPFDDSHDGRDFGQCSLEMKAIFIIFRF